MAILLTPVHCAVDAPPTPTSPSIVLILIDTLRADYLGISGFLGSISPHLDEFAEESVIFDRCYTPAPSTLPAVASLFTSLHPDAHGVMSLRPPTLKTRVLRPDQTRANAIPDRAITLAEALSNAGYMTAAFVANPWLDPAFGFDRGFQRFDNRMADNQMEAEVVLASASAWLRRQRRQNPFFLYLHLMDVHGPYTAPESDVAKLRDSPSLGEDRPLDDAESGRLPSYLTTPAWTSTREGGRLRGWRTRYAAGVHSVDRQLATFIEEQRSMGILDEAIVVVTSDHGEELCEHGGWGHGKTLYQHQLHVPLIIRFPSTNLRGVRVSEVVSLIDLMPTLLTATGLATPDGVAGRDLAPLIRQLPADAWDHLSLAAGVKKQPWLHSLFDGRNKLIADMKKLRVELYDLVDDPHEQVDVADQHPELTRQLLDRLRDELARIHSEALPLGEEPLLAPDLEERLRALGYLE